MKLSEKDLKKRLIEKRKIVKQKLDILKHGEIVKEKLFSPITKHLKDIENKLGQTVSKNSNKPRLIQNKTSMGDDSVFEDETNKSTDEQQYFMTPQKLSEELYTPTGSFSLKEDQDEEPSEQKLSILKGIDEYNIDSLPSTSNENDVTDLTYDDDDVELYESLARKYIDGMHRDEENKIFDHKYGVRYDVGTGGLMIGDSNLSIDGSDIIVKNKRYRGTIGLYELLFKKNPHKYNLNDVDRYKQIVLKTNAHKRYYKPTQQVDGSKLKKYKKIIAPMVSGKGILMEVNKSNKIDYIHWDDPNELVSRLRLLLSSVSAGHTGHRNEINSLIEELREANIIM